MVRRFQDGRLDMKTRNFLSKSFLLQSLPDAPRLSEPEQVKIEKSLAESYRKGFCGCVMTGLCQDYFTPLVLFLGGSAPLVGIMNACHNLGSALAQFISPELAEGMRFRRRLIGVFAFLQGFFLIVLSLLIAAGRVHPVHAVVLTAGYMIAGAVLGPAWASLLSDLAPAHRRGDYFGWRSRNLGMMIVASSAAAGLILHLTKGLSLAYGFAFIFAAAGISRLTGLYFLRRMYEPPLHYTREDHFTLVQFFARSRESNFVKFVLFVGGMNFAVNLAAPFFSVFMLKDLQFSYLQFMSVNMVAPLTLYLVSRRWGRHADRVGNLRVIILTSRLLALNPVLWILCHHPVFLWGAEALSGFLWAGFNLCTTNFIFDAVKPEKRPRCIAYYTLVNGLALSAGALLGGYLVSRVPLLFGHQVLMLFLISSLARMAVSLTLPAFVREVRPVEEARGRDVLVSMLGLRWSWDIRGR